jgi:hypothetical protein
MAEARAHYVLIFGANQAAVEDSFEAEGADIDSGGAAPED